MGIGLDFLARFGLAEAQPVAAAPGGAWALPRARVEISPSALIAWARANLSAEQERWFPWVAAGFGTGLAIYFALRVEPPLWLAGAVALAGCALAFVSRRAPGVMLRFFCILATAASLGFSTAKLRTDAIAAPVIKHDMGPLMVQGRIETVSPEANKRVRIVLAPTAIGTSETNLPARLRLTLRGDKAQAAVIPGAFVSVFAMLRPPPDPVLPHGFDFARWAFFRGIGGVGYGMGAPKTIVPAHDVGWLERFMAQIETMRLAMARRVAAAIPGPDGGIAAALITGERGAIVDEDYGAYRGSGLAHILAIAGLHMALVGLGIFWALRALLALSPHLALTQPIKKWAAVAAFGSATFYLLISGASVPTTRAYIMLSAMLLAVLADRPALSMRAVGMAAIFIMVWEPESVIETSFQMSFSAIVSLIAFAEWEARRPRSDAPKPKGIMRIVRGARVYIVGLLLSSLVASAANTPFAVFYFDRAADYSLLGNVLALPIVGFVVMPAAALSVFLMPFGLDYWPLQIMGFGVHQVSAIAHWVTSLPGAVTPVPAWPVSALALIIFGGLWAGLWRRRWRWLGAAPIVAGLAVGTLATPPDLIVARDAHMVAVRQAGGTLVILGKKPDEYTATQWLLREGDGGDWQAASAGAQCDDLGCVAHGANGQVVSLALRPGALTDDCQRADVLVSAIPVRGSCPHPRLVIDRLDIARSGAMSAWFDGNAIKIETVAELRGRRPWVPQYLRTRPTSLP